MIYDAVFLLGTAGGAEEEEEEEEEEEDKEEESDVLPFDDVSVVGNVVVALAP